MPMDWMAEEVLTIPKAKNPASCRSAACKNPVVSTQFDDSTMREIWLTCIVLRMQGVVPQTAPVCLSGRTFAYFQVQGDRVSVFWASHWRRKPMLGNDEAENGDMTSMKVPW